MPRFALWSAVLLGAALRFYAIGFGLPYSHARPDETTALAHAGAILAGDPNPHFFNWPSLTLYLFAGVITAVSWVKGTLARADLFVVARITVALAGTMTIVVLARLAQRIDGARTAAIAALFLAVAVLHVRDSHFATTDVVMTLLVTASLTLLVETIDTPFTRVYAIAGLIGGLAISAKYSAAPIAIAGLFACPPRPHRWKSASLFLIAIGAGFLVGTPYGIADFATLRADVLYERAHLAAGHAGAVSLPAWLQHATRSLPYGLGLGIFGAALAGVALLGVQHRRRALPVLAFAVLYFVVAGSGRSAFFRYVLPLVPIACLSAAVFVRWLGERMAGRVRQPAARVSVLIAVVVAAPSFLNSVRLDARLARTDTRVRAAEWLMSRLQPESTLYDAGGDYTRLELGATAFHDWRYDPATNTFAGAGGRTPEWLVLYDSPIGAYASIAPALRDLAAQRYTLVHEERGMQGGDAIVDPQDAFFLPLAGFDRTVRPGPNIYIFQVR